MNPPRHGALAPLRRRAPRPAPPRRRRRTAAARLQTQRCGPRRLRGSAGQPLASSLASTALGLAAAVGRPPRQQPPHRDAFNASSASAKAARRRRQPVSRKPSCSGLESSRGLPRRRVDLDASHGHSTLEASNGRVGLGGGPGGGQQRRTPSFQRNPQPPRLPRRAAGRGLALRPVDRCRPTFCSSQQSLALLKMLKKAFKEA